MYSFNFERYDAGWWEAQVTPIFGDDNKVTIKREEGERYCRYGFSGEFTFVKGDYQYFINYGINARYRMTIYLNDNSGNSVKIIESYFTLADMDLDDDN